MADMRANLQGLRLAPTKQALIAPTARRGMVGESVCPVSRVPRLPYFCHGVLLNTPRLSYFGTLDSLSYFLHSSLQLSIPADGNIGSASGNSTASHTMRLIVTDTGQFVEINNPAQYVYAILSHTWDTDKPEQSFREVREIQSAVGIPILPESALDEEFFTRIIRASDSRSTSLRAESVLDEDVVESFVCSIVPPSGFPSSSASPETHALSPSCEKVRTAVTRWGKEMQRSVAPVIKALSHRARPLHTGPTSSTLDPSGSTKFMLASSVHPNATGVDLSSHVPTRLSILDQPRLSWKIKGACAVARAYGYRLVWIDSCCIEKESSAELSEAINSMFSWYRCATVCFAFIPDLPLDLVV
ncbi:HET-domain-containing protein [Polyporus arcularius HHB13444]|uniref:HET-domain-containing protein n=1 Tax=Polyporus arcularius HHB13444 TaxID=1314778 RepID=A0A5C3NPI4_9APHY|nr:HET-domain-containing protein [Polyporus arcularius HHB13444]